MFCKLGLMSGLSWGCLVLSWTVVDLCWAEARLGREFTGLEMLLVCVTFVGLRETSWHLPLVIHRVMVHLSAVSFGCQVLLHVGSSMISR